MPASSNSTEQDKDIAKIQQQQQQNQSKLTKIKYSEWAQVAVRSFGI